MQPLDPPSKPSFLAPLLGRGPGRDRLLLTLIVLLAAGLRLGLLALPRVIRWDEPAYLMLGRSLWTGGGYTIAGAPELHYPPLFPALAGLTFQATGDPELATEIWYVLLGALSVLPVYALARRAYGPRVALAGALLVAGFPALTTSVLYWGTMTEPLFILLVYSALWLAAGSVDRDSATGFAGAGALTGLAYLARPEGIGWLAAVVAATGVTLACRRRLRRWRSVWLLAACLGGFLLCAFPYVAYLHDVTGRWQLTGKLGITYEIGEAVLSDDTALYDEITNRLDPESGEMRWWSDERFTPGAAGRLVEDPRSVFSRVLANVRRLLGNALTQPVFPAFLVPFALLALAPPWSRGRLAREVWLFAAAAPVVAFLPYHVQQRFFAPALPAGLAFAAVGLWVAGSWVTRRLPEGRWKPGGGPATVASFLLAAVLVGLVPVHFAIFHRQHPTSRFAHERVGLWLREHSPADAAILASYDVCVYAERRCLGSPRAEYPELLAYARRRGATHLLIDERQVRETRPFLIPLLDPSDPPAELDAVFRARDQQGEAILYRIKG